MGHFVVVLERGQAAQLIARVGSGLGSEGAPRLAQHAAIGIGLAMGRLGRQSGDGDGERVRLLAHELGRDEQLHRVASVAARERATGCGVAFGFHLVNSTYSFANN